MKPQTIFLAIFVLISQYSYCQNETHKNHLSLSIGPSIPIGNFSSTNPLNNLSGFAKLGETINLSVIHRLNKNFGLIAMLYGQRNSLNTISLAHQFAETGIYFGSIGGRPNYYPNWVIDKKSWYVESILLGVGDEFLIGSNSRLSFIVKALIGIANVQLPKLNASSETDTSFATITQNGGSTFGLSYLASVGIKFKLNKKFRLVFNTDYFGASKVNFKNVTEQIIATNGGLTVPGVHSFANSVLSPQGISFTTTNKQPIGVVNINFGAALRL